MTAPDKVTVDNREREIYRLLGDQADAGADVQTIYRTVSERLSDGVTEQAYRKILDRLTATGRIELLATGKGPRRYALSPHLHAGNALTLDDVHELLDTLRPSEAIARLVAARDYYEQHRTTVLTEAACRLQQENPRDLVERFLVYSVDVLEADVAVLRETELRDKTVESRVGTRVREINQIAHRYLGLTRNAIDIPPAVTNPNSTETVHLNIEELREQLRHRVFGDKAVRRVDAAENAARPEWQRFSVAGSDGSTHASVLRLTNPTAFAEDVGSQVVTFNNSVAYIDPAPVLNGRVRDKYTGVPMTRSALDDPSHRGMVMAPFMYRYLSPSEYEHTAKAATDVVQWRVDLDVFSGTARSLGNGDALPQPHVHFRNGTVKLQEREWGHYRRSNEYGDMVREGVRASRRVLERVLASADQRPIFAGTVKAVQTHLFSAVLNWYIAHGSASGGRAPVDAGWDMARAAHIGDNDAMSLLLSTLQKDTPRGSFWVTFVAMRTFASTTEFYRQPRSDSQSEWTQFFEGKRQADEAAYNSGDEVDPPYLLTVPSIADENFVWMCRNADYFSFYISHTAGSPPLAIPCYEFLESVRSMGAERADTVVRTNVDSIVAALVRTGLSEEHYGGVSATRPRGRIVPRVLYEAHEKGKAVGQLLEDRLQRSVVENLHRLRGTVLKPSDVELRPQSIRNFVQRYRASLPDDDAPT